MNSQTLALRVAGTLFGLMSLAQLFRLLIKARVFVNDHQLPLWPSAVAWIVLGGLSLWMWQASNRPAKLP